VALVHERALGGVEGHARALGRAGAGQHRPRLRDRVDLALVAARRAPGPAVVVEGAHVPAAVPGAALEGLAQLLGAPRPRRRQLVAPAQPAQRDEALDRRDREPAQPDALSDAPAPDPVHAVVPVAAPDQRKTVRAAGDAALERALAVL